MSIIMIVFLLGLVVSFGAMFTKVGRMPFDIAVFLCLLLTMLGVLR